MRLLKLVVLFVALLLPSIAQQHDSYVATIASDSAVSTDIVLPVKGCVPGGVVLDSWTGTSITFQVKLGNTYYDLYDPYGVLVRLTVASNRATLIDMPSLYTFKVFRIRSGTPASPVTQPSTVDVRVTCR